MSKLSSLPRITRFSHFFVCVMTGADRSVRFPRRAAGADERSGSTSGDTGGKRSGTGEEPERLQKWFVLNKIIYWHKILNIVKPLCVNTIKLTLPAFFISDKQEEQMLMEWFCLIHERHVLMCRDTELVHL